MAELVSIFWNSFIGYAHYLWHTITHPFDGFNYFTYLIILSLVIWGLEILIPWRKNQAVIRKGFWQDAFYMFFNFYIFNLLLFVALSKITFNLFGQAVSAIGLPESYVFDLSGIPQWSQFLLFFLINDFVQWSVHNILHRVPFLWKFHKLHHSVTEMGFAAHLRFHWLETFLYKTFVFVVLSYLLNFRLEYAFLLHAFAILIGHLNHANLGWDYGPLKYVLNNPKMHIWHHAKKLPKEFPKGMNYGITLSIWDYLFRTAYVPSDGRDIELGFEGVETYPEGFLEQQLRPFKE
jgi:sterol desaturase/sphingolipid hydroxylase (fatty acid hydroxylase superfamily)